MTEHAVNTLTDIVPSKAPPRMLQVLATLALLVGTSRALTDSMLLRAFPYNENAVQRYRVGITPTRPDTGITNGYVVAYGYYILPPYEVTARDGTTYVNGVRIQPLLEQPPPPKDTTPRAKGPVERWARIGSHLDMVPFRVAELFRAGRAAGLDDVRASARAESIVVATDSLVDSVRFSGRTIWVYGPEVEKHGRPYVERRFGTLPDPNYVKPHPDSLRAVLARSAEHLASNLRHELLLGRCRTFSWGDEGSYGAKFLRELEPLVLGARHPQDRWLGLLRLCGPAMAYPICANFETSRATWDSLTLRLNKGH